MGCPCETRTSTCRSFATISSGLYRFLAITVLLDVQDIPQVGPLQWGRITAAPQRQLAPRAARRISRFLHSFKDFSFLRFVLSASISSVDEGQRPSHGPRCGHQYDRGYEHQTEQTE